MLANAPTREGYSRPEVRRMLSVSERTLRSWEKQGLIESAGQFGFRDLIALRALQKLSENKIPAKQIARAIESLKKKLKGIERPLNELRIVSNGRTIAVQLAGQKMDAISGQLLFDFEVSSLPAVRTIPAAKKTESKAGPGEESETWFQRGLLLEETGAPPEQALAAYRKAIELNPHAAGALVNLGTIAFRSRKLREAAAYYQRAIEADPKYPLAQFNLGNVFDEMGELGSARKHYEVALSLSPEYADAHFNLALIAERNSDNMAALKHWKAYLKLDGMSTWADQARKQIDRLRRITVVE